MAKQGAEKRRHSRLPLRIRIQYRIDKNLLIDGVSIGKLKLCVKRKPQQDVGLYLIRHFRED